MTQGLRFQGLEKDPVRGFTTGGGQRQTLSRTYGFLTPRGTQILFDDGYKVDEDAAKDETQRTYDPTQSSRGNDNPAKEWEVGSAAQAAASPQSRRDEGIRFRTRSGAQILISESEGIVYLINRDGTAWVEMAQDGKIDVFANDSVSVHSYGSINLTAQEDVNIEAGRNINIKARGSTTEHSAAGTGNIFIESSDATHLTSGGNCYLFVGGNGEIMVQNRIHVRSDSFDQNVNEDYSLCVQNDQSITVGRDRQDNVKGDCDINYEKDNYVHVGQNQTVDIDNDAHLNVGNNYYFMSGNDVHWIVGKDTYEAWPMGGVIHYGHAFDYVVPPCIPPSAAVRTCAEAKPIPPSAPEPRTPVLPENPDIAEKPIVNILTENKTYANSISNRVPEHEPWQGHRILKTSTHAPYTGPVGNIDDVSALTSTPPAGSTAYSGLAPGGGIKGNTKPELATIDFNAIKQSTQAVASNPAKAVSTASAGQEVTLATTEKNVEISTPIVNTLVMSIEDNPLGAVTDLIEAAIQETTLLLNEQIPPIVNTIAENSNDATGKAKNDINGANNDITNATIKATTTALSALYADAQFIISGEISIDDAIANTISAIRNENSKEVTEVIRKVDNLTASFKGKLYIANFEKYIPYEYPDGIASNNSIRTLIGYGHIVTDTSNNAITLLEKGLTEEEAWALFEEDLKNIEKQLLRKFVVTPAQHQFEALLDFVYNRGLNNPDVASAIRAFNEGRLIDIQSIMLGNAATNGGDLIERRQSNINLFYRGDYGNLITRLELKKSGLKDYTLVHWTGEHLWKSFPGFKHKEFPDEEITKRVIKAAWFSWDRSIDKDNFALPLQLPNNTLIDRVGGLSKLEKEAKPPLMPIDIDPSSLLLF
ncbi:MAG: hypothetical protein HC836_10765 [Richelia sp. RM2_1_2]|nr:hypothetical protein [Richelia sp. RM2_1_2]